MLAATVAGMAVRHVDGAGAEPMRLVASTSVAMNIDARGDVLGLVGDVLADIALDEASSSARMKASRSSLSDTRQSLPKGWIGMVKKPSSISFLNASAGIT